MALTSLQQEQVLKYTVAILGVAPGGYMDTLADYINAQPDQDTLEGQNAATHNLGLILASCPAFKALGFAYSDASTNEQFVTSFLANLLPATITAANVTAAQNWMLGLMTNGMSRAEAVVTAVEAVATVSETDENWGAARMQLENRYEVANTYTIANEGTSTDISYLQNMLAGVTDDHSTVDNANTESIGETYVLTTGIDSIPGTSGNDLILGSNDVNGSGDVTFSIGDVINGAGGNDTLQVANDAGTMNLNARTIDEPVKTQ